MISRHRGSLAIFFSVIRDEFSVWSPPRFLKLGIRAILSIMVEDCGNGLEKIWRCDNLLLFHHLRGGESLFGYAYTYISELA